MSTTTEDKASASVHSLADARVKKQEQPRRRLIGRREVEDRCMIKKSLIYEGMAAGTFPKRLRLPGSRSVAWVEAEIEAWIDAVLVANGRVAEANAQATQGGAS